MGRRYRGGGRASGSNVFSTDLPEEWITPSLIYDHRVSTDLLRREYSRLRDVVQKRIKRMEGHPEAQETYAENVGQYPTIKEIKEASWDDQSFRKALAMGINKEAQFLTARRGSLSGIREMNKDITQALKENLGINVSTDDLTSFGNFMNAMKKAYHIKGRRRGFLDRDFASDQFARLWDKLNSKGNITQESYNEAIREVLSSISQEAEEPTLKSLKKSDGTYASDYFRKSRLNKRTVNAAKRRAAQGKTKTKAQKTSAKKTTGRKARKKTTRKKR